MDALLTVVACLALVAGFTLAGMSVLKRRGSAKGAPGTLGSVLGILDATGAPTRTESAAAREELKQRRHESAQSGKGPDHNEAYTGKITIRAVRPPAAAPEQPAAVPNKTGAAADVKGTNTI
jgi:hypothetical protein